jgi:MerR family transcriptional regulator, light-induced transcriptional regulator
MNSFTIKDLESLSGIKAHTIRIWEQRYTFLKPRRTETNIRYYTCDELKTVLNIALLNKYGFKISHIDKMNDDEINQKLVSLTDTQAQQEKLVNDLIGYMIDLGDDRFEAAIDRYIQSRGIERTINQLIFPFLERIGILWQTNHINAAQEHLVTNIIRQKLIVGIDNAASHISSNKTVLLFLPEGEHHELGLLYVYYLLRGRGVKVVYLGANVPYKDVAYIATVKKPDSLYAHITCVPGNSKLEKYLTQLRNEVENTPIVISGQLAQNPGRHRVGGIQFKKSLPEVLEYISSL